MIHRPFARLRRLVATSAAALAVSLSGGCVQGGAGTNLAATPAAAVPTVQARPAGALPGPALWRLSDADTTIYLFGTVHALPKDKTWMDARIERAFESSDELVTEIDVRNAAGSAASLQQAGRLPAGQTLRQMMAPDDRTQYEAALVKLGVPVESLDRMKPWLAAMTMTLLPLLRSGYDQQSGVELTLSGNAEGPAKRGALETVAEQVALFDGMPIEEQLKFLDSTVEEMDRAGSSLDAMVADWLEGDAEGLAALMNAEMDDPVLYDRLLTSRNAKWAEWIDARMEQPGTVFIAVGAGHLAGQGSVQDQLARRGIAVERVWQ